MKFICIARKKALFPAKNQAKSRSEKAANMRMPPAGPRRRGIIPGGGPITRLASLLGLRPAAAGGAALP